ncbi:hypothetical protein WICPIJ_000619 [Wickerhamomyces pijperi]|uniref:Uncharacterized protein n=1 Tax=Wickerhamomyces pijperi TaxID=599730 RepID=A0A9P8QDF3_WICPI|nr:hypothetical protein WICPIJ_000619 [Wickerhamomyces pijperi]
MNQDLSSSHCTSNDTDQLSSGQVTRVDGFVTNSDKIEDLPTVGLTPSNQVVDITGDTRVTIWANPETLVDLQAEKNSIVQNSVDGVTISTIHTDRWNTNTLNNLQIR